MTNNIIVQTRGKPILNDKQTRIFSTAIAPDIGKYIAENKEAFEASRVSGVSSTKEEKEQSKKVIGRIYNFLNEIGFEKPIVADSGNGFHLVYKISAE